MADYVGTGTTLSVGRDKFYMTSSQKVSIELIKLADEIRIAALQAVDAST